MLRAIARKRSALDADEARWLREAEALQIWKPLGMVSALDYMERVLGYAPRTAHERLRVARALGTLPALTDALARGTLSFSAVRELTRVATPATEAEWVEAARDKNLRDIEELVATHRPGDLPDDPGEQEPRTHVLRLELQPETYATLRQACLALEQEQGRHLDDNALIAVLSHIALDGESNGRARYRIAIQRCDSCQRATQLAAGARIAIGDAAVERAPCDAQLVRAGRAKQAIPPATRRAVWLRDHGRCRIPGRRSARGLECHHIEHREHGGTHDESNLVLLCSSCHQTHHDRRLKIAGSAERLQVTRPRAHVGTIDDAISALTGLGWKPAIARRAVERATVELGPRAALEPLIRRALQLCN